MNDQKNRGNLTFVDILKDYVLPFLCPSSYPNLGIVMAGAFGLLFLIQMIWTSYPEEKLFYSKTSLIGYSLITLVRLLALLLVYVLVTEHYKIKEHHTWGRNPGLGGFFMSFLAGIPAMMISVSVHNLFIYLELKLENPIPSQLYYYVTSERSVYGILLLLVMVVLFPILIEELFFRGLVYAVIPDRWWLRITIPTILSALFAVNRLELPSLLVIGLICSLVRYYTDNTLASCMTRIGYFCMRILLSSILSLQDPDLVQNAIDYNKTTLYSSIIGVSLGIVMMLVLIRQLRTVRYLQKNEDIRCGSEDGKPLSIPLKEHFHVDFIIGVAFLALCWIMS